MITYDPPLAELLALVLDDGKVCVARVQSVQDEFGQSCQNLVDREEERIVVRLESCLAAGILGHPDKRSARSGGEGQQRASRSGSHDEDKSGPIGHSGRERTK
jgi:hypothetical protein